MEGGLDMYIPGGGEEGTGEADHPRPFTTSFLAPTLPNLDLHYRYTPTTSLQGRSTGTLGEANNSMYVCMYGVIQGR